MIICNTFKEARKAAREYYYDHKYRGPWLYIGKIKCGKNKETGKDRYLYMISMGIFHEADFIVNCKDGRICKISNLEAENKLWNRHPEMNGRAFPFRYKVRNRRPGEDKKKYLEDMSIEGRFKYNYE